MVNWMDPARVQSDAATFQKIMLLVLGLYSWEIVTTLKYDWTVVTGRKAFKYPMACYFLCRYTLLLAIIGINIALNNTTKLNCQALYTINQTAGNIAIGTASSLLLLRTLAIWSRKIWIVAPLTLLSLGQWGILLHGVVTVRSSWSDTYHACVVTDTKPVFLQLIYIYTMTFDLIVLITSSVGLIMTTGRSHLWELLFKDGIVYFVIAFSANLIPTIFLLLNLNPAMNIMTTVPAAVASSVVACRGFVRLSTYGREVYLQASGNSPNPTRPMTGAGIADPATKSATKSNHLGRNLRLGTGSKLGEGVHISMEAYTTVDARGPSPYGANKADDDDFSSTDIEHGMGYTSNGRPIAGEPKISFVPDLNGRK